MDFLILCIYLNEIQEPQHLMTYGLNNGLHGLHILQFSIRSEEGIDLVHLQKQRVNEIVTNLLVINFLVNAG
jgi:hypothetical protein